MESLLVRLRRFYLLLSLPTLALMALAYMAADIPLVDDKTNYYVKTGLFMLALVFVPVSHWVLKRAVRKCDDQPDDVQAKIYGKGYKIRLTMLNVVSYLSAICYFVTVDEGSLLMFGCMAVVVALSYPSRQYVMRDQD